MATEYKLSYTANEINEKLGKIDTLALKSEVPTNTSDLTNDSGFITNSALSNCIEYTELPNIFNTYLAGYATESWVNKELEDYVPNTELQNAINDALAQAKESGEFDGKDGENGLAPRIAPDGNWWVGDTNTGVKAAGEDGTSVTVKSVSESTADGGDNVVTFSDGKTVTIKNGNKGADGYTPVKGIDYFDGKSAYQYAKDGGYTGTEEEFAEKQAQEIPDSLPASDVYAWAKEPNKPSYTADEVGAASKEEVSQISETVANLGGVPDYVVSEGKSVADKVIEKRTINSLVFLAASDIHVTANESTREAIKHMGQGMSEITKHVTPDCIAFLGDYNYGSTPPNKAQGIEDMKYCRACVADVVGKYPSVWMVGNHDYYSVSTSDTENRLSEDMVYALIGSHNTDKVVVDMDNLGRNYGYIDFEKQRIRLIYLNTTDCANEKYSYHLISTVQGQWFVTKALDLSDKGEDEEKWGVIVCAHVPLFEHSQIVTALGNFVDRTSGRNFSQSYDYTNTKAELIAVFHGHIHNFKVNETTTTGGNTIKYICIPNAVPGRENPYTVGEGYKAEYDDGIAYNKTAGTADDTSFNVIVIDRENSLIHAICYGAGIDRTINYNNEDVVYSISNMLTNVSTSNEATTVELNGSYTTTLTADDGYVLDTVTVAMDGEDITSSVYSNGTISISAVTGNVVITATAIVETPSTPVNQIPLSTDSTGAIYNGTGYKENTRIGSDGTDRTGATGKYATGFIPVTVGDKLYFYNCEILQTGTGTDIYNHIVCYDSNKSRLGAVYLQNDISSLHTFTKDENNNLTMFDTSNLNASTAFVRIVGNYIGADSVITKNQPIDNVLTYYTIERNLISCTSSSNVANVLENSVHTETLSADDGYELDSVVITMGGEDITNSVYSDGVISITNVTGDIVITVSAISSTTIVNQIPISIDANGDIYNGIGYKPDSYLSSSSGDVSSSAKTGYGTTGFIPIGVGSSAYATGEQVLYLKNIEASPSDGNVRIWFYTDNSVESKIVYQTPNSFKTEAEPNFAIYTLGDDGYIDSIDLTAFTFYLSDSDTYQKSTAYIRICAKGLDGDSIITVNQPL